MIHSDETHDLSATAEWLSEKFGLPIHTVPYGCRRNVRSARLIESAPRFDPSTSASVLISSCTRFSTTELNR